MPSVTFKAFHDLCLPKLYSVISCHLSQHTHTHTHIINYSHQKNISQTPYTHIVPLIRVFFLPFICQQKIDNFSRSFNMQSNATFSGKPHGTFPSPPFLVTQTQSVIISIVSPQHLQISYNKAATTITIASIIYQVPNMCQTLWQIFSMSYYLYSNN